MDSQRIQRHLESLIQGRTSPQVQALVPVISRWNELLSAIPGLQKRHPGTHCRVAGLTAGVLTVEADHPAWLQLLQWNESELVRRLQTAFPVLEVRSVLFRLSRPGEPVERPTVVMPSPVKADLTAEERAEMDQLLGDLQALIDQGRPKAKNPD